MLCRENLAAENSVAYIWCPVRDFMHRQCWQTMKAMKFLFVRKTNVYQTSANKYQPIPPFSATDWLFPNKGCELGSKDLIYSVILSHETRVRYHRQVYKDVKKTDDQ